MSTVFKCESLTKEYKYTNALDNINLCLEDGRIYGLIGNNGAGKTTLMRIIMGLAKSSSGSIELFGEKDEKKIMKMRKRIGVIIENPIYQASMSGIQNLRFLSILYGVKDKHAADNAMQLVKLDKNNKTPVGRYSLGMKQRLSLAGALIGEPDFIILDEPLNGLDPSGQQEIRQILLDMFEARNVPMLISSHNLEQLHLLATDYIILHNGKIVEEISNPSLTRKCKESVSILERASDNRKHKGDYMFVYSDSSQIADDAIKQNFDECICEIIDENKLKVVNFSGEIRELYKAFRVANVGITKIESIGITVEDYFNNLVGGKNK